MKYLFLLVNVLILAPAIALFLAGLAEEGWVVETEGGANIGLGILGCALFVAGGFDTVWLMLLGAPWRRRE